MERIVKEESEEGRIEGNAEGEARINKLISILIKTNRYDDLERSIEDPEYQKQLMIELLPSEMLDV